MTLPTIAELVARGALFVINHSGGKDSQAMDIAMRFIPRDQLVVVHADLGRVEWSGAMAHIEATTNANRVIKCEPVRGFLQMVEDRGMFPSPDVRQCTSDLKRGPIEKVIRHLTYERKKAGHPAWNLVVNCMGLRADESRNRAKLRPFALNKKNSKAGREWYDWLPIHDWDEGRVFATIKMAGQSPHRVYLLGMKRFSCVFCIYADDASLTLAAKLSTKYPELVNDPTIYKTMVGLERSTGQVMMMPKNGVKRSLVDITGVQP